MATDLPEAEVNRVVSALEERGVASEKSELAGTDHFAVTVPRGDASRAAVALADDGLPAPDAPGLAAALANGGLVPSLAADQARLLAATASELERTLRDVPGALSARVHLAVQRRDPLSGTEPPPGKASVLVRRRAGAPGPSAEDVKRLVAGAVSGVERENVAVVIVDVPRGLPADVVQLGPFSTNRKTARAVRVWLGGAAVLNVSLVAVLVSLWLRVRRRRTKTAARIPGEAR